MKKAQGALEFLMTYGWAFLVILIMIGALAYFGVLNPSKYLPDKCLSPIGLTCDKDRMIVRTDPASTAKFVMKNGLMDSVTITNIRVTTDSAVAGACTTSFNNSIAVSAMPAPVTWADGATGEILTNCAGAAAFVPGNKIKIIAAIDYYPSSAGPSYYKNATADFTVTIR